MYTFGDGVGKGGGVYMYAFVCLVYQMYYLQRTKRKSTWDCGISLSIMLYSIVEVLLHNE